MPRPIPPVDHAIEAQAVLHALRRACGPLWEAAMASGSWTLMAESKALAETLRSAQVQLRRISGEIESIACPDGEAKAGHGRAA
jgi:hypothetical protein